MKSRRAESIEGGQKKDQRVTVAEQNEGHGNSGEQGTDRHEPRLGIFIAEIAE